MLNDEGIPSPAGQKWNTSRLAKLICNPVYRGAICWNKHTMGSLFGLDDNGVLRPKKQKGWRTNAESDWIISENVHEPLVSPDTWQAAQRAVAKRRADAGKARPTQQTLLANLLVCKRCGHSFTTICDRRWPGPTGEGYRYYTCSGYHRYGKGACRLLNLPGPALDAFVLATIKRLLLAEHKSIEQAIERFVKAVLVPKRRPKPSRDAQRELEAVNRKIKAVVAMLADPAFDGLDELRTTLSELKARRDALQARLKPANVVLEPAMSEAELRAWAMEQFARLDELATRTSADLKDRQLVAAFVERTEIDPDAKTGVIFIAADLEQAFRSSSTRVPIGDDPQSDESARSLAQCATRESILAGAVLGLAGAGKKISGTMPCTVIRLGDMADTILNRDQHPEWNAARTKLVYSFPVDEKLWQRYAELRAESFRRGGHGEEATKFYRQNREAMDAGAIVAWPERFNHDELSAIQRAMNVKLQDEAAFFAEYQNEPLPEETAEPDELTADQIAGKLNDTVQQRGRLERL